LRRFAEGGLDGRYPASVGVRALEVLAKISGLIVDRSASLVETQVAYTLDLGSGLAEDGAAE
jgi:hypothetical protein